MVPRSRPSRICQSWISDSAGLVPAISAARASWKQKPASMRSAAVPSTILGLRRSWTSCHSRGSHQARAMAAAMPKNNGAPPRIERNDAPTSASPPIFHQRSPANIPRTAMTTPSTKTNHIPHPVRACHGAMLPISTATSLPAATTGAAYSRKAALPRLVAAADSPSATAVRMKAMPNTNESTRRELLANAAAANTSSAKTPPVWLASHSQPLSARPGRTSSAEPPRGNN